MTDAWGEPNTTLLPSIRHNEQVYMEYKKQDTQLYENWHVTMQYF
jgi:hypothetical protein